MTDHGISVYSTTAREKAAALNDDEDTRAKINATDNEMKGLSVQEKAVRLYRGEALAPMVRASTTPLRVLALHYGADFCYTEELMDRSLIGTNRIINNDLQTIDYVKDVSKMGAKQQRKLQVDGGPALYLRIDPAVERHQLVCQVGTGEPELAVAAARHVCRDVSAIDINMGCPKKFSVGGGMGSALLNDVDRACRIVRAVSNAVSTTSATTDSDHAVSIPVSCKIRLLKDVASTLDFITALVERGGAHAIAIHGRHVGDLEVQTARWDELAQVVSLATRKFPHTPILLNGDFYTRHDMYSMLQEHTPLAAGVLLARPALYNTSIFIKPPTTATTITTSEASSERSSGHTSADCTNADHRHDSSIYGYNSPLLLDKTTVIQDYLRYAIQYDAHYKNVKYVVCEMMNSRRAPHVRAPHLTQNVFASSTQTIGTTCACTNLADICKVWNINYQTERDKWHTRRRQRLEQQQQQQEQRLWSELHPPSTSDSPIEPTPLPGEHQYLDSYIMKMTEGGDVAAAGALVTSSSNGNRVLVPSSTTAVAAAPSNKRARMDNSATT